MVAELGLQQIKGQVAEVDRGPALPRHVRKEKAQTQGADIEIDQPLHIFGYDIHIVDPLELEHRVLSLTSDEKEPGSHHSVLRSAIETRCRAP
jgi:hypothetical protein